MSIRLLFHIFEYLNLLNLFVNSMSIHFDILIVVAVHCLNEVTQGCASGPDMMPMSF